MQATLLPNLPDTDYHADLSRQSCSMLKNILTSPAHYMQSIGASMKPTDEMVFGTLVHALVLEPHTFATKFAVYPDLKDGRDSAYKSFVAAHAGRNVVDDFTLARAQDAAERLVSSTYMGRPVQRFLEEGIPEATIHYTDITGIACRTRIDLFHEDVIIDLKTTSFPTTDRWLSHALHLHYDMQAFMYQLSVKHLKAKTLPFVFLSVESEPPHSIGKRTSGETFLESGRVKYQKAIQSLLACRMASYWPAHDVDETIEISHWQHPASTIEWASALVG